MSFTSESFDAVIYIASLQFIEQYTQAIKETARVLRSNGKLLVMLLNPQSTYFKERLSKSNSYIHRIRHTDLKQMEKAIADEFFIQTEYLLGIKGKRLFQSQEANTASLYVIQGIKKDRAVNT